MRKTILTIMSTIGFGTCLLAQNIPAGVDFSSTNKIYYTTMEGNTVNFPGVNGTLIENTYENGLGCATFDNDVVSFSGDAIEWVSCLRSLYIPATVKDIGGAAFRGCENLTTLVVAPGNTTFDSRENCNAIIETATNTLVEGSNATVIPSDIVTIRSNAFDGRRNLTAIDFPEGLERIEWDAFISCSSLESVHIPASVNYIDSNPWRYSEGMPLSVTVAEENPIFDSRENCNAIIETETNTLRVGGKNSTIPEGIEYLGNFAFDGCTGLVSLTIPSTMKSTEFGGSALTAISTLQDVICLAPTPFDGFNGCFTVSSLGTATLHIPAGSAEAYLKTEGIENWGRVVEIGNESNPICETVTIDRVKYQLNYLEGLAIVARQNPEEISGDIVIPVQIEYENHSFNVSKLVGCCFSGCENITSVTLPNSIQCIPNSAFDMMGALRSVFIPAGVSKIEGSAFMCLGNLESIVVDPANPIYDSRDNCDAIIETATNTLIFGANCTTIPNTVVKIEGGAFDGSRDRDIEIPSSVKEIGWVSFYRDYGLTKITLSEGLEILQGGALACCGITDITIPASVNRIDGGCLWGWLETIKVAEGNQVYDSRENCNAVIETATNRLISGSKTAFIPKSVTSIAREAFAGIEIAAIELPYRISKIEGRAFADCRNLNDVYCYAPEPPALEDDVFAVHANLHVPAGLKETYEAAGEWGQFTIYDDLPEQVIVFPMKYENIVYFPETTVKAGQHVKLQMHLKNSQENIMGFQFKLYLPDGITLDTNDRGKYDISFNAETDRSSTQYHTLSSALQPDGSIMVLCYSSDLNVFLGTEGALLDFAVTVSDDIIAGEYDIIQDNIVMTTDNSQKITVGAVASKLIVPSYTLGDANDDGGIDVSDIAITANYILGNNPEGFVFEAADMDEDGIVDVADIAGIANLILYGPQPSQMSNKTRDALKAALDTNLKALHIEELMDQILEIVTNE